jgi:hypothetical protein
MIGAERLRTHAFGAERLREHACVLRRSAPIINVQMAKLTHKHVGYRKHARTHKHVGHCKHVRMHLRRLSLCVVAHTVCRQQCSDDGRA